jgi:hypothetical protein
MGGQYICSEGSCELKGERACGKEREKEPVERKSGVSLQWEGEAGS